MGVTQGDLNAVQGRVLSYQGQREFRSSQQGAMRWAQFRGHVIGYSDATYGPWDSMAVAEGMQICKFPVAFAEEPMMDVMVALADGESWDGVSFPAVAACSVAWRRVKERQIFVGANVSVSVKGLADGQKSVVTIMFYGPAVATPLNTTPEIEFSTGGPDWDMAEWLWTDAPP